jgi:hypothetical protein
MKILTLTHKLIRDYVPVLQHCRQISYMLNICIKANLFFRSVLIAMERLSDRKMPNDVGCLCLLKQMCKIYAGGGSIHPCL